MENKDLYELFNDSKSTTEALKKLNMCDNSNNWKKVTQMMIDCGFDKNIYKKRKERFCLNCGEKLNNTQKKFCSCSCSATYTNKGKKQTEETKNKISYALKNKEKTIKEKTLFFKNKKTKITKKEKKDYICLNCGEKIKNNKTYCSNECKYNKKHSDYYKTFLLNPDFFNRGNYTPKIFKPDFLYEQNYKCAICEMENIWCGKNIVFVLDHIDGDASNNSRNNLRMICPNCDSQTDTFKSKNKNSKRRNYWKEKIIKDNFL